MKVAVSIPDPIFQAAESLARRRKVSRSQLYATALEQLIEGQGDYEITAQLDALYAREPSALDEGLAFAQAEALREKW